MVQVVNFLNAFHVFLMIQKKSMGLNLGHINVHLALSNRVPNLWIGSAGPVLWPLRRPAVTIMDFYFGAMLKNCSIEEILNLYRLTQRSATAFFCHTLYPPMHRGST